MKILYFLCFFLSACNYQPKDKPAAETEKVALPPRNKLSHENMDSNAKVTYRIVNSIDNTFGYDVFIDQKKVIHQPNIPGTEGNLGFQTKMDAQKVAELVRSKILHGEMPPTVRIEEIRKLNLSTEI